MLITRKNARGGRQLKTFPLVEDHGLLGYQIGYCDCGCNEKLILRTTDTQEILAHLFHSQKEYKKLVQKLAPKNSYRKKFKKWALGKLVEVVENENQIVYN